MGGPFRAVRSASGHADEWRFSGGELIGEARSEGEYAPVDG